MAHLTAAVRARTAGQRSIVSRRELRQLGATDRQIQHWIESHGLERLHRGVYAVGGAAITPAARVDAAVRRAGRSARAGGRSALALAGLDGFRFADEPGPHEPVVVLPPGRWLEGVEFAWIAVDLPDHARCETHGIASVTVADALVQAADEATAKQVRVAFDDAARRDLTSGRELEQAVRRLEGSVPGAAEVAALLADGTLQLESEGERDLAAIFGPEDPQPVWQVRIGGFRVDAVFVEARLVLEYQGRRHHHSEHDRRADRARAAKLRTDHGIEIIEVRAGDLANPVALRERVLAVRAERLRAGVSPLRDYTVAAR